MEFNEKLRDLRKSKGLTQEQLAAAAVMLLLLLRTAAVKCIAAKPLEPTVRQPVLPLPGASVWVDRRESLCYNVRIKQMYDFITEHTKAHAFYTCAVREMCQSGQSIYKNGQNAFFKRSDSLALSFRKKLFCRNFFLIVLYEKVPNLPLWQRFFAVKKRPLPPLFMKILR